MTDASNCFVALMTKMTETVMFLLTQMTQFHNSDDW